MDEIFCTEPVTMNFRLLNTILSNLDTVYCAYPQQACGMDVYVEIVMALSKHALGVPDWKRFMEQLCDILSVTHRKVGRSFILATICAVLMMSVPNFDVHFAVSTKRQAGPEDDILGVVAVILCTCFECTDFKVRNRESLVGMFPDERRITVFSGTESNE